MTCNRCNTKGPCNKCKDNGCLSLVYPQCIITTTAYPCLGVPASKTGLDLFSAIEASICNLNGNIVNINQFINTVEGDITTIDNSITSINNSITTINETLSDVSGCLFNSTGGCEIENLSLEITNINNEISTIGCLTWIDLLPAGDSPVGDQVPFNTNWDNQDTYSGGPFAPAGYATSGTCNIKLRGFIRGPIYDPLVSIVYTMFTLPSGFRPSESRVFPATFILENTISANYDGNHASGFIVIQTDGKVRLWWNGRVGPTAVIQNPGVPPDSTWVYVALDHIIFEL